MNKNDDYYPRLQAIINLLRDQSDNDDEQKVELSDEKEEEQQQQESEQQETKQEESEKEDVKDLIFKEEDEKRLERISKANDASDRRRVIAEEFEKVIVEFLEDYPDSPEAYFLVGRQAFLNYSFVVAWESFNKAWELDQTVLEYADAIAVLSSHLGKIKEGAFFAKLSLILEPHQHLKYLTIKKLTDYKLSLFQIYETTSNFTSMLHPFSMGEYSKVINILESEIQINDKHALSYYYLGFSYYKLGHYHIALNHIRTAYLLEDENSGYLPLLTEVCLRLHMYNEAYGYLAELEDVNKSGKMIAQVLKQKYLIMNNAYDDSKALTKSLWHNIKEIEKLKDNKKQLPDYLMTPYTNVYARIGVMINSSSVSDTISTLISTPDRFHTIIYDVDDAKEREKSILGNNVIDYKNLFELDDRSAAMTIRGEALDILIDATDYSTNGSYTKYAYDDVASLKLSWLSHLEKPFIDGILYSDNHNKLDSYFKTAKKKPYKIRNAISLPIPTMFATVKEPPAFTNGYINLGVVATRENLTPLFLSQLSIILRKISFVNINFGYNDLLTESYKDELITYFAGLKLHKRISFSHSSKQDTPENYNPKIEFLRGIDIFLNGGKTDIDAISYSLFSGVPSFCLLDGSGESVIAVSTLSSANADKDRVFDSIDDCIKEMLNIIEDPEVLAKIRADLIQSIPNSLLFNSHVNKNTFWEDIYAISQSVDSKYHKIS